MVATDSATATSSPLRGRPATAGVTVTSVVRHSPSATGSAAETTCGRVVPVPGWPWLPFGSSSRGGVGVVVGGVVVVASAVASCADDVSRVWSPLPPSSAVPTHTSATTTPSTSSRRTQ